MRLHAIVSGKVQGVWFRAWTRDMARELSVTGWVRNRSDGLVEAMAEGSREQLMAFETRLRDGPPLARVTKIKAEWSDDEKNFTAFNVRR